MTGRRRNHGLWIGPLVTIAGAISYFTLFARYAVLRDFPWINLPLVLIGLAVSAIALGRAYSRRSSHRGKILGSIGLAASVLVSSAFVLYVFWLSSGLPAPTQLTQQLTVAPQFTLVDHTGRSVRLDDYRGKRVLLVFYRGHW